MLPAVNESAIIARTIDDALRNLRALGCPFELIVVDNASADNTGAIVTAIASKVPEVSLIRHATNLGYAQSNLTGFRRATGNVIAVSDSDGQHTLADLPLFLDQVERGADVVFGWRRERRDPAFRKVISAGLNTAASTLLDWKLHDINCGFRVVTAQVAKSLESVRPTNYFGPQLWVHCLKQGFQVEEVQVRHAERKSGTSIHIPWKLPAIVGGVFADLLELRADLREACAEPSKATVFTPEN